VAEVGTPCPVELVVGVIFRDADLLEEVQRELEACFGVIELRSTIFDFDATDYYAPEMGPNLKRAFYAFRDLMAPDEIVEAKLSTNRIESVLSRDGRRRVNLDPGYMDFYKFVLASVKFLGQKVYLGKGVYADPTLYYDKGWKPYDWGFPDFKSGRYDAFLISVRDSYKQKVRGWSGTGGPGAGAAARE
jgi:hypothetical protein